MAIATTTATMRMPFDASLFIGTSDKGVPPYYIGSEPRLLAASTSFSPHPLDARPRGVFVAVADVAVHDLDQLIADSGGQPVIVSQVEHSAITRPKRDLDPTQTLTEHAQKIRISLGGVKARPFYFCYDRFGMARRLTRCVVQVPARR